MSTTIIGLDGANRQVVDPLLKPGQLPVLKKLIDNGCHGIPHSTTPPNLPPAWASMIPDVNPGKHNVFDGTDKIQRFFWKYWGSRHPRHDPQASMALKQAIPDYYRDVDTLLGEVIVARGESDAFIVSDKSMGTWCLYRGMAPTKRLFEFEITTSLS